MSFTVGVDTYATLAEARAIAESRGWSLPADDTQAEISLRNGVDYIDMQEPRFSGSRVSDSQALAWPRSGASYCDGRAIADGAYPAELLRAQVAAAAEYGAGTDVRASTDGRITTMERVEGAVTVQYSDRSGDGSAVTIRRAMDALKPLLCGPDGVFQFRVNRG